MHIPDGFLSTPVIATTYTLSLGSLSLVWRKIQQQFQQQAVPQIAMLAAFIFVAQMINIPISGGTSGHLIGGILTAVIVGPYVAIFVLSLVLTVQMFIFQDGGLTALGANIFNMSIAGLSIGYLFYLAMGRIFKKYAHHKFLGMINIFIAAWISVEISAVFCALELSFSGMAELNLILGLMAGSHALIGILEGIMTLLIFQAVWHIRPDIIRTSELIHRNEPS